MTKFRLMLLSTAAAGLVSVAVSPASAGEVEKSLSVSGHINRAIVVSDNGDSTGIAMIDNNNTGESRFRLVGKAKSESLTFGTLIELGAATNRNVASDGTASTLIRIRHSKMSVSNDMGTLHLGYTWKADWLTTSNNLNGASVAGFTDGHTEGGESIILKNDTGTADAGITVNTATANYTGYRENGIKYVTPNMSGFKAEASYGTTNGGAASLRYSGDFDGTKVAATAGWGSLAGTSTADAQYGGSVAIALAGGLTASVAYSERDLNANAGVGAKDPTMWAAAIGYNMGANAVNLTYQSNDNIGGVDNTEGKTVGILVQHNMKDYGASVYGGIENVEYDSTAADYEDLTAGWVGVKVTF